MLKVKYASKKELEQCLNEVKNIQNILVNDGVYTIVYEEKNEKKEKIKIFDKAKLSL